MNYFSILQPVVSNTLAQLCNGIGLPQYNSICEGMKAHLENMSQEWFNHLGPNIPYEQSICRLAYLYGHAPAHANLCEVVIRLDPALSEYLLNILDTTATLRVCAFGGGPGTELLGITGWLLRTRPDGPPSWLTCTVMDGVNEWADSLSALRGAIRNYLATQFGPNPAAHPVHLESNFAYVDMTNLGTYANYQAMFGDNDLYVLNFVVSELSNSAPAFGSVLAHIVNTAPVGARFLFIDRNDKTGTLVTELTNGLLVMSPPNVSATNMDTVHQKSAYGQLVQHIGRDPKTKWNAFWQVGTKMG